MLILGIDTSCDDTSSSVVEDGYRILSNVVSSQEEIHQRYGGIVPELASRRHLENIIPVVQSSLDKAGVSQNDIDAVAVCYGPGLIGSLLVGCCFVKAICYCFNKKIVTVNHLLGHINAIFLTDTKPSFPFICLVVSGGHTSLYRVNSHTDVVEMGKTLDDAAGEAYDKVAKMLGLGYPGGPRIDILSKEGNSYAFELPRAYLPDTFNFSFSGIKTAVKRLITEKGQTDGLSASIIKDISASFQRAIIDVLIKKIEWAVKTTGIKEVVISGGVAANRELRQRALSFGNQHDINIFFPPPYLCTDNGAMIAVVGYHEILQGRTSELDFNPKAYLPLG
ncbi:MAG: tRNA (adenosine(37)-N6)-threonylcarbamoyltransferase complex transferase subunit TsaD [Thermodesulfovibrionales bacterium]|nr:tRNA (adenosine(37)-N6)-threonylcarbamoyltransferase complex transferase subunit TsaD [Thermodesulfovibrionales bacterium]